MALTRKFLQAMSIEDEKIDQIINAHTEVTNALKEERDSYKTEAEKLPDVQKQLDDLKKIAGEDGKNPWKVKYEAIKEEYDNFKSEIETKQLAESKTKAIKAMLRDIGISDKRIDTVAKVIDTQDLKLDDKGNFTNADDLRKSLTEEWKDFIPTQTVKGSDVANPPAKTSGAKMSRDEIMKIKDATERQKAISENLQSFGY